MNVKTTSLVGLLSLHDDEFVDAAYLAVLGRDPDAEGRAYYLARVRTGYSKLSVLNQLRASGEPHNGANVRGLSSGLRRYRLGRLPLLGWLFRKLLRVEGETVAERLQRTLISELAALRHDLATRPDAPGVPASPAARAGTAPQRSAMTEQRRNLVAEQLSPRAREIFDRLVSG
jgi:Domain of unknown function (DUF4214)